ncbi:hypothetical protein [Candidatus Halocynthiibacter alkanivorans]|uniref:hypothetical protein n=1 Tax=Candidatus Halocynthiibacter alkanivorans TaxID=2267619 RepID=UPI000DF13D09|nr:hypothetical protein [Candidatus Halocynthiibacter alkanivorans]
MCDRLAAGGATRAADDSVATAVGFTVGRLGTRAGLENSGRSGHALTFPVDQRDRIARSVRLV